MSVRFDFVLAVLKGEEGDAAAAAAVAVAVVVVVVVDDDDDDDDDDARLPGVEAVVGDAIVFVVLSSSRGDSS